MIFRLAIAGNLPQEPEILAMLDTQLSQLKDRLRTGGQEWELQLLVSPSYTGGAWRDSAAVKENSLCGYSMGEDPEWDALCSLVIREDTALRSMLGEEICDRADLMLMFWNEDVRELDGASWELLQLANNRRTPCIWISTKTRQTYWAQESIYEWYAPEHLNRLCEVYHSEPMEPHAAEGKKIPLLNLGIALRNRYMCKHKALGGKVDAERDDLMSADYSIDRETPSGEELRQELLKQFHRYDDSAIELNSRYQAVLYWRAILPFVTSVFLAVGFYAENVLGVLAFSGSFWKTVAGFGFLIHGLLNLYVYILSRSETIRQWHKGFLNDRFVAEILRVQIHFAPYGIHLNLRKLCGKNSRAYMTLLRMLGKSETGKREISRTAIRHMLDHVEQMLEDQIAYHTVSERRYSGIVEKLDKWYHWVFGAGFAAVILRALLQFIWVVWPVGAGELNGIAYSKFASSFANMVALMLPGWASYFSTKLSQCNFRYNSQNHQRMIARLTQELERIRNMRRSVEEIPLEALSNLSEELAEIMLLEDTASWYHQYQTITVKHL